MKKPEATLIIMAAGMGTRFGRGIKQLEKIGPNGEILMDYSIYDARKAGFTKVVFIIRKEIEQDFKEAIGDRIAKQMHVDYVFQEKEDIPEGYGPYPERKKPWGTGHAILCCKGVVNEPFAIINADDYYGSKAFELIYRYLTEEHEKKAPIDLCMAGFELKNTLSENGTVTRGICEADACGYLTSVHETHGIRANSDGQIEREEMDVEVSPDSLVSMNMWGGYPEFIDCLKEGFCDFLDGYQPELENQKKQEFLLPIYIDRLLKEKKASVKMLKTDDKWFGITYQEDRDAVIRQIAELEQAGMYR